MWLAKQVLRQAKPTATEIGVITMAGNEQAVHTDREYRNITVYAPGGYFWRPDFGQNMLVLKDANDNACISGMLQSPPADIQAGEVYIKSKTAEIKLKNDGSIRISGAVQIDGSLSINGTEIC